MGEVLTIQGTGFGDQRGENRVTIAGITPTASSYIEWKNDRIAVRIPDFGESGLVYVHAAGRKSNAALFTNRDSMPLPVSPEDAGVGPRILAVEPAAARIGTAIVITGRNFGASRENGSVRFAWDAEESPSAPAAVRAPDSIEASEVEFGYELWSDREIRVRVPDGAVSGNLTVSTARGDAIPVFFETIDRPGTKTFKEKRSFVVSYSVDVKASRASGPSSLYLWVPRPGNGPSQRNTKLLSRSMEPFVDGHRGAALFQIKDLGENQSSSIALSYLVDVYAVETKVKPQAIKTDSASPIQTAYLGSPLLIPSDDREIVNTAERIVGKEKNPYLKAKKIYDWITTELSIATTTQTGGALAALQNRKADAYSATLLFCALARSADIPALPDAGFLVDRNRTATRHFWAEFWIDGFGWVPVDPALGAGAAPAGFTLRPDSREYYFGNVDSQRIIFSRGLSVLSPMDPRGRVAARDRGYAFQTLWEEAVGGLESYSSLWSDITVTGVY
jgi:transglutaminase-like putative cysteine protease